MLIPNTTKRMREKFALAKIKIYTTKDVRESYSNDKQLDEKHNQWLIYMIFRPCSFVISAIFLNFRITANQISLVSLLFCLALPMVYLFPSKTAFFILALSICICYLLDCIDGDMARASGDVSTTGHYLDFITDVIFRISSYFALVLIIYITPEYTNNSFYWAYCLGAAWFTTAARLSRVFAKSLKKADREVYSRESKDTYNWVDRVFFAVSSIDHALPIFIFSMVFFENLDWLIGWIFVYALADFVFTQFLIFKVLR